MALSPAQIQFLHETAQALRAAGSGQRGSLMRRAAAALGCAEKTLYARLRKYAGWESGKKKRCDAGKTCVNPDLAQLVGGMVLVSRRQNGKQTLSIKGTHSILKEQGYGAVNPETGEVTMPSPETLSRAMRHYGCHPKQLAGGKPAVSLRSLHPNHTWQVDASVCVLYRLKGSNSIKLLSEREYNKHKPGKLIEIADYRVIRYIVVDHYSHNIFLRYEQARSEDALGVIVTLMDAMCDRGPRDPMHGVPFQLYMDKGSGNTSSLVLNFLEKLTIRPLYHAAGNARATGAVEVAQNIVECGFESKLRFMDIPSLESLQAQADAWRRHINAHAIHSRLKCPRNEAWLWIEAEQLRTVERPVLQAIAAWKDESRKVDAKFHISVDTKAFGVQEYDLRELGYHGLCSGDSVKVRLNPFRAPVLTVIKTQPDGTDLIFDVAPILKDKAGFDCSAPILGEEYKSLPDTLTDKNLKQIMQRAYNVTSDEEARKAHQSRKLPYADIDITADITEAPLYYRRKGAALTMESNTAQPVALKHVQAATRLKEMCGDIWKNNATACMDMLMECFPVSVPEDKLPDLADAITARFAPRPATILTMPQREEAVCASA